MRPGLFKGCNLGAMFERHADLVQTLKQAHASERLNLECGFEAIFGRNNALL